MSKAMYALGRLKTGSMNKTETAYDSHLAALQHAGQIKWRKFEGLKLRLADNTFYTPDFAVMAADGEQRDHVDGRVARRVEPVHQRRDCHQ